MKDVKKFLKTKRQASGYRPVSERIKDYREVNLTRPRYESSEQTARCMDCSTPFCHWACPLGNYIPEWNDMASSGQWKKAAELLLRNNNMPEITGRLCPALCEYGCVLGINDDPITIRDNELDIIERAFKDGLIKPRPPLKRTGKKVAVIGSGPAGLTVADQLNKAGHKVVLYEKDKKTGGLLRYGIPDFKLDKGIIDRRINILKKEGIEFKTGIKIGQEVSSGKIKKEYDAVCLAIGSAMPRDLNIPGRDLKGIYFAMDYLRQSNMRIAKESFCGIDSIDAKGKKVVVIGGGDTGADCVGTANRQGAESVVQIEVLPKPSEERTCDYPWPSYPVLLKTSTSHQEGGKRMWSVLTKQFKGQEGHLRKLSCVNVEFIKTDASPRMQMREVKGSEFEIEADQVILAVGFLAPERKGIVEDLGLKLDERGNIKTDSNYMSSKKGIFCAGDAHRGQSLVVWAVYEGRQAAHYIDTYLMGKSSLPVF